MSFFNQIKQVLLKTKTNLAQVLGLSKIDDQWFDQLLEALILADVNAQVAQEIVDQLKHEVKVDAKHHETVDAVKQTLVRLLAEQLIAVEAPLPYPLKNQHSALLPYVIFVAGVNGAGKTTSLGKLSRFFTQNDRSVLLVAGDTFRAAAKEQLSIWADRSQSKHRVHFFEKPQADPASVAFDAAMYARQHQIDVVLVDSAGRLPTQLHLLEELKKMKRVLAKAHEGAPHETLLVIDGSNGQNALHQAKIFHEKIGLTGLIVTKLDGSAKGGVLVSIAHHLKIPVRFLGMGETLDDLIPFAACDFARALIES